MSYGIMLKLEMYKRGNEIYLIVIDICSMVRNL